MFHPKCANNLIILHILHPKYANSLLKLNFLYFILNVPIIYLPFASYIPLCICQ
jgi:hypothetical protein